jgi:hypothetical protein
MTPEKYLLTRKVEQSLQIVNKFRHRFNTDIFTDEGKQNEDDLVFLENTLRSSFPQPVREPEPEYEGDG